MYNVVRNTRTGGWFCIFENNNQYYYADLSYTPDHGNECMIFKSNKDGDFKGCEDVYCDRCIPVTEEQLIKCIEEFKSM